MHTLTNEYVRYGEMNNKLCAYDYKQGSFKVSFKGLSLGLVVKTSLSNAGGAGSIPGWEAKIPHASWPKT